MGSRLFMLENAARLRTTLEAVAEELEDIENEISERYGLYLLAQYRQLKLAFAGSAAAQERLSSYWKEMAIERVSALDQPIYSLLRHIPAGAYRSMLLDRLHAERSALETVAQSLEIEPTLATLDGAEKQASYDHTRAIWQAREVECSRIPTCTTFTTELLRSETYAALAREEQLPVIPLEELFNSKQRRTALNQALTSALAQYGPRFGLALDKRGTKQSASLRFDGSPELHLSMMRSPARDLEWRQISFWIVIAEAGHRFNSRKPPREGAYLAYDLEQLFTGYSDAYGTFRNSREFDLSVFASCAIVSTFAQRFFAKWLKPRETGNESRFTHDT